MKVLHRFLTDRWWILQGGFDDEALAEWLLVTQVLELDAKASRDLLLLAQSGRVGRAHANRILWETLTGPGLGPDYEDLSHLITNRVYLARRSFDRPPREHRDLSWWWWTCYESPYPKDLRWAPDEVPATRWVLQKGPGGKPLPPPECWGQGGHLRFLKGEEYLQDLLC